MFYQTSTEKFQEFFLVPNPRGDKKPLEIGIQQE